MATKLGELLSGQFWGRFKSWIGLQPHQWPEGEPLMSGDVRWGTRLKDGTIIGAPGVSFTPVCSRCQQAIEAETEQTDAAQAECLSQKGIARGMVA